MMCDDHDVVADRRRDVGDDDQNGGYGSNHNDNDHTVEIEENIITPYPGVEITSFLSSDQQQERASSSSSISITRGVPVLYIHI